MSIFSEIADKGKKITDGALGEASSIFGKDSLELLSSGSTKIVDSMRSLPGANELKNLGFPQFDDLFQSGDAARSMNRGASGLDGILDKVGDLFGNNSPVRDLSGAGGNPLDRILGGSTGFDRTLGSAKDLLNGSSDSFLNDILGSKGSLDSGLSGLLGKSGVLDSVGGVFGQNGSGGLGDIFGGLKGVLGASNGGLGGILGGLEGMIGGSGGGLSGILGSFGKLLPAISSLLPVLLQVAPLAAAVL